ncbi:sigma-70 family RNA polymerase sigma factor [Terrabacter carboxydivorans]|uniref:RNA polymerase sigma factor, sigma-70 family n=1 Tax=Terrabacter carboxydivorans TaxID=619730 RepID=A0ABP5Y545_9MICO
MSADATLWSSEAWASAPDSYLLLRTREGSAEAFGELWRRHLPAAYAVAGRHRGRSAPEDIVAEAASRVLGLIRDGRGPDENFRAYFLSAVRTVAIDQGRRDLRVVPAEADDLEELAEPHEDHLAFIAADEEGVALVRRAFAGLSERDQRVLWHTTVEGAAPRAVAPALGMTANAVSVRAMRARESLRALYLDARAERGLVGADSDECRWTVSHLGALVRGRLPKRQTERAEAHVAGCAHAAAIADDLRLLHDGFPAMLVPLVLAAGLGTSGFVSVVALFGLSGGAAATSSPPSTASGASGASGAPASGASGAGAVAQVASQVTALVAGLAVTAGVAGALALPTSSLAAPSAAPVPSASVTSPGASGANRSNANQTNGSTGRASTPVPTASPGSTVSASAVPSAAALTGTPTAGPAPAVTGSAPAVTGSAPARDTTPSGVTAGGGSSSPTPPTGSHPAPVPAGGVPSTPPTSATPTPTTPPAPTPTPAPPQPGGTAPTVSARLVSKGDPARISLTVRSQSAGSLTLRVSNASGSGALTVRNSSWSCAQAGAWAVRCSGTRGQVLLDQSGTGGVLSLVVRLTDASGHSWTETIRPT